MRERAVQSGSETSEVYLDLGGVKKVRIICRDPGFAEIIKCHLRWCVTSPVSVPDDVIYVWKEPCFNNFHKDILGVEIDRGEDGYVLLARKEEDNLEVFSEFEYDNGVLRLWDGNEHFFAFERADDETLLRSGHIFAKSLFRIVNTPSTSLVHGACVGVDGKGALICAKGGKGKSTLSVTALLKGFDYVSDDYLILEKKDREILSYPLYSIITLSPEMRRRLSPDVSPARFIADNARKDKLVFDISAWTDSVRYGYPIRVCLFPEIADVSSPAIIPCPAAEKGKAITNLVYSTMSQMLIKGDSRWSLKVINMLQGLDFYKIILSPDLFGNVECLREFLINYK